MAMIVKQEDDSRLIRWAEPRIGVAPGKMAKDALALGVFDADTGEIAAVILINARYGHFCSMHIASDGGRRWATRRVLRAIFGYAFEFLGHTRINAVVSVNNLAAQIMAMKLGFRPEATIACGADDGGDGILFRMLIGECDWLKDEEKSHG